MPFFGGKSKEDLIREHCIRVFQLSAEAANATKAFCADNGVTLSHTQWFGVLMEYQNLYIQLTDRSMFAAVRDPKRKEVMDEFCEMAIETTVAVICKDWGFERIKRIQAESMENYKTSCMDYGACKRVLPDKGETPAGTMIWEFSKTLTNLVEQGVDIMYVMFFTEHVDFQNIRIREFVDGISALPSPPAD